MVKRPYFNTISTTTAGGSVSLPSGLKILYITNDDDTNFTKISINAAIGTANNDEATILATKSLDFTNSCEQIGGNNLTLYFKADTAAVAVTIIGYIS